MNEFIEQFLIEAHELIEQATGDLLALEADPEDRARLDGVFRAFHTLKGAAGIIDFAAMGEALHEVESVLSAVRAGKLQVTAVLVGDCLWALDQIVQWLEVIEATGEPPSDAKAAADQVAARFIRFAMTSSALTPEPVTAPVGDLGALGETLIAAQLALLQEGSEPGRLGSAQRAAANCLRHLGRHAEAEAIEAVLLDAGPGALAEVLRGVIGEADAPRAPAPQKAHETRSLRVDVERIEALVRLAGETMVVKNALGHLSRLAQDPGQVQAVARGLKDQQAHLERLVRELQRAVLALRVLPMSNAFQPFPRLVREMAAALGKPVRLVVEGEDVEADKAVVESLFEPLLHVLRNALDHGLETPSQRAAASKPPVASLHLRAAREGESVLIEVEDDGSGVDLDRVRQVAVQRGLVAAEDAATMDEAQVLDLIFAPGFSTAATVTDLSGRGVGMDAVRIAIERIGGRVKLDSRPGIGTRVSFLLPFTVMISRLMTVQAGGQTFGLPLGAVVETVRVARADITPIGGTAAFVLRERTVPLFSLAQLLEGAGDTPSVGDATVVVVEVEGQVSGLEVEAVGAPMDVILRPMDSLLAGAPGLAGATLLGDGAVMLVLDLADQLQSFDSTGP